MPSYPSSDRSRSRPAVSRAFAIIRPRLQPWGWTVASIVAPVALALLLPVMAAAKPTEIVAVYSKTDNGYKRARLPDNSFKPEFYTFAPGGRLNGVVKDDSIDRLSFYQVAAVVSQSLRAENYLGTGNPRLASLLIFLSWGTTTGVDDRQSSNGMAMLGSIDTDSALEMIGPDMEDRDRNDQWNAGVLGYTKELRDAMFLLPYTDTAHDILEEVEESRYFIVLQAYDFQDLWRHHEKRLLWETRFSIRQFGNRFDRQLPSMTQYASHFYGQNLDKLIHRRLPEGHVHVGVPVVVPDHPAK